MYIYIYIYIYIVTIILHIQTDTSYDHLGKWILHENYIQDSYSNKEWLNEEKYEWSLEMDHDLTSGCGKETLLSVPKQCRLTYRGLSKGPFVNWKVGLACEKKTFPTYKRLALR